MSLATYADLQGEILLWLRRPDLTRAIPSFIRMTEAQMNRVLRARQMMIRNDAFVASESLTALPDDFLAVCSLRNPTTKNVLRAVSAQMMDADLGTYDRQAGNPVRYSVEGDNLRLSPAPSDSITLSLLYWASIPALSDEQPTNWLLSAHPDAYLYGALLQSAPYLKADERLATWAQLYQSVISDINNLGRQMGDALDVQPSTYAAGII